MALAGLTTIVIAYTCIIPKWRQFVTSDSSISNLISFAIPASVSRASMDFYGDVELNTLSKLDDNPMKSSHVKFSKTVMA